MVALVFWLPVLFCLNPNLGHGPLFGFIPASVYTNSNAITLWLGLPIVSCLGLLAAARLAGSKDLVVCAVMMPVTAFGFFVLLCFCGMGSFR